MEQRPFFNFFFIPLMCCVFISCNTDANVVRNAHHYDLNNPKKLLLNDALLEISGITFYPKDSTVFAISDESGYLFKIFIRPKPIIRTWKFSKAEDFEDLELVDSIFYVLRSNGDVYALKFSPKGDTIYRRKYIFPYGNGNDFESLYYQPKDSSLILICKNCKNEDKHTTTAFSLNPQTGVYSHSVYVIQNDSIAKMIGEKSLKFRPSAAALHPLTNDLWILSSVNKMIVVANDSGRIKDLFTLNPSKYIQPEGIAFTPWGDLLISNEAGDKYGIPNLYIFKYHK